LPVSRLERDDLVFSPVSDRTVLRTLTVPEQLVPVPNGKPSVFECSAEFPFSRTAVHSALQVKLSANVDGAASVRFDLPNGETTWTKDVPCQAHSMSMPCTWPLPDLPDCRATLTFRAESGAANASVYIHKATIIEDMADEDSRLHIVGAGANGVQVENRDLPDYRLLVFVEAAYPGWHATIDGKETPIYRANNAFQAILMSPGDHSVVFTFRSRMVVLGVLTGAVSTLLMLIGIAATYSQARRGVARKRAMGRGVARKRAMAGGNPEDRAIWPCDTGFPP